MKKSFKGFKVSTFITTLILGFIYPAAKAYLSTNKLVVFSDTCFIMSMFFIVVGIFNILYQKGDLDNITYIGRRAFYKQSAESYDVFKKNVNYIRKDSFNYPIFMAFLLILSSIITALFA